MTLSFPSHFIPSSTVVLAMVLAIEATLKTSVDDDDDDDDECLWYYRHDKVIEGVYLVHLMNIEQRQAAAEPQTSH